MLVVDTVGLAHPRSQDSLLPTCHLLINTETDLRVKWLVENFIQCVWCAVNGASKWLAIYSVHAEKWRLTCVYCVLGITYQLQPQQKPHWWLRCDLNTHCLPTWYIMQQGMDTSTRLGQPPDSSFTPNRVGIRVLPFWPKKPTVWAINYPGYMGGLGHSVHHMLFDILLQLFVAQFLDYTCLVCLTVLGAPLGLC